MEHDFKESCFILAVAIAVAEDLGGSMRLIAPDACLDGNVSDILLNKVDHCSQLLPAEEDTDAVNSFTFAVISGVVSSRSVVKPAYQLPTSLQEFRFTEAG